MSQTPIAPSSSTPAASSSSSARQPGQLLDPPRGWLGTASHLGPGLIISASIVGSGELIVTPKVGAALGFSMLWFIIVGCIVKVFVQIELARFAIVERVTTLEALNSVPGPRLRVSWLLWFWLFMYLGLVFQIAGLIGGCVMIFETMNFNVSREVLLIAVVGSGALLLVTGRYKVVEVGSTLMVAAFTISTIVAMIALQWTPYRVSSAQLIDGLKFQLPASFTVAFAAFGIIGVGASELVYYPYWCLEKGYARHIGPRDDSPDWRRRMLGWLHVLHADAVLSMVIYTGATIAFYILGAAVLHGQGLQVTDRELIETLSHMYQADARHGGRLDLPHWSIRGSVLHLLRRDGVERAAVRRRRRHFRSGALPRRGGEIAYGARGVRGPADCVGHGVLSVSAARHPRPHRRDRPGADAAVPRRRRAVLSPPASLGCHPQRRAVDVRPLALRARDDARRRIPAGADAEADVLGARWKTASRLDWDIASEAFLRCSKMDEPFEQPVNDRLIELAEIETGHTVVDVATGIGDPALSAARRVGPSGRVIATDQSSAMLAVAASRARDAGLTNIEFRQLDANVFDFPDETIDAIVCRWGLMFLSDLPDALAPDAAFPQGRGAVSPAATWSEPDKVPIISLRRSVMRAFDIPHRSERSVSAFVGRRC